MIEYKNFKFTGKIDRRSPFTEGDPNSPIVRENFISRDMRNRPVKGTEAINTKTFTSEPKWIARYYSGESSVISPKTFIYTKDGRLWTLLEPQNYKYKQIKESLNTGAYPKQVLFKLGDQNIMYFVDGLNLYKYDGNNDFLFEKVDTADSQGDSIEPIDLIEHKDRLILLTKTHLSVSKNLAPDVHNDPTDSIHIIVGSGQGRNLALGKIEDRLYIFNTEGIFALVGDTISALAITFEIRKVDDHRLITSRSLQLVEGALVGIFDDFNLWSWNGSRITKLSHEEKLEDFINKKPDMLEKMVSVYEDNFYKLSFVETGTYHNNLEIWYDAFTQNIDFVRGRNVAHYLEVDKTKEEQFYMFAHSSSNKIMWAERGAQFDKSDIILRLKTRNIIPYQGRNVRFYGFYPEIEPIGTRYVTITYLLDGRLGGTWKNWSQVTTGETVGLGMISFQNQTEVVHRVRPQIKHSRGHSIAFDINIKGFNTTDWGLVSLGMEYIPKARIKGRGVSK